MIPYYISQDCIAAFLDKDEAMNIDEALACWLIAAGCTPWDGVEAELYPLGGRSLLIARPRPPLRERLKGRYPRLRRR